MKLSTESVIVLIVVGGAVVVVLIRYVAGKLKSKNHRCSYCTNLSCGCNLRAGKEVQRKDQ